MIGHWHTMASTVGCLPDYNMTHKYKKYAVEDARMLVGQSPEYRKVRGTPMWVAENGMNYINVFHCTDMVCETEGDEDR